MTGDRTQELPTLRELLTGEGAQIYSHKLSLVLASSHRQSTVISNWSSLVHSTSVPYLFSVPLHCHYTPPPIKLSNLQCPLPRLRISSTTTGHPSTNFFWRTGPALRRRPKGKLQVSRSTATSWFWGAACSISFALFPRPCKKESL